MRATITDVGRVYLRWALTDGVGPLTFTRLLIQFGDAEAALGVSARALQAVMGIGPEKADRIARGPDPDDLAREIDAAAAAGVQIVAKADPDYPEGLRRLPDAPIVLFVKGALRPTDAIALAVVGSRRCTIYGSEQARRFGELLAGAGFTVVSGLARGIDAFAHHGAVEAGGRSIAVMGRGLGQVYPPENAALAEKLLEAGAWISELPMQAAVRAENFPGRNRIIAGLTLGTLVVEAAARSGALITARLAAEYNREVFAVPGRVQDPMSIGTNALIRDSAAKLVTCLEDILDELGDVGARLKQSTSGAAADAGAGPLFGAEGARPPDTDAPAPTSAGPPQPPAPGESAPRPVPVLSLSEKRVYDVLGYEPVLQDVVLRGAGLPPGEVLAAITGLELKGLVRRFPGNLIARRGLA